METPFYRAKVNKYHVKISLAICLYYVRQRNVDWCFCTAIVSDIRLYIYIQFNIGM